MTDLANTHTTVDQRVLVGTPDGLFELGATESLITSHINAMTADATAIWVLQDGTTLWRIDADGTTPVARVRAGTARALAAADGDVWVGGADATLWRLGGSELERVESFDRAPTHDGWHTPWGGAPDVFSIDARDGDVFVNVHVGGILRSSDRGATWQPTIDLHDDVHHVAVDDSGRVWAATGMRGLARSVDRGATWEYVTDGLHSTYALAVAPTVDGALVCTSSGPRARDGRLYRLDGERLAPSVDGLPTDLGGTIGGARIASVADEVVMAAPDGAVYRSDDGGRRWHRVTDEIGATTVALLPRSR